MDGCLNWHNSQFLKRNTLDLFWKNTDCGIEKSWDVFMYIANPEYAFMNFQSQSG